MVTYSAPLDDLRFVLRDLHDYGGRVAGSAGLRGSDPGSD